MGWWDSKHKGDAKTFNCMSLFKEKNTFKKLALSWSPGWYKGLFKKVGTGVFDGQALDLILDNLKSRARDDEIKLYLDSVFEVLKKLKPKLGFFEVLGALINPRKIMDQNEALIKSVIDVVLADFLKIEDKDGLLYSQVFELFQEMGSLREELSKRSAKELLEFIEEVKEGKHDVPKDWYQYFHADKAGIAYCEYWQEQSERARNNAEFLTGKLREEVARVTLICRLNHLLKPKMREDLSDFSGVLVPFVFEGKNSLVDKDVGGECCVEKSFHFKRENIARMVGDHIDFASLDSIVPVGRFEAQASVLLFLAAFLKRGGFKGAINGQVEKKIREKFFFDYHKHDPKESNISEMFKIYSKDEWSFKKTFWDVFKVNFPDALPEGAISDLSSNETFNVFLDTSNLNFDDSFVKLWQKFWGKTKEERTLKDILYLIQGFSSEAIGRRLNEIVDELKRKYKKNKKEFQEGFFSKLIEKFEAKQEEHLQRIIEESVGKNSIFLQEGLEEKRPDNQFVEVPVEDVGSSVSEAVDIIEGVAISAENGEPEQQAGDLDEDTSVEGIDSLESDKSDESDESDEFEEIDDIEGVGINAENGEPEQQVEVLGEKASENDIDSLESEESDDIESVETSAEDYEPEQYVGDLYEDTSVEGIDSLESDKSDDIEGVGINAEDYELEQQAGSLDAEVPGFKDNQSIPEMVEVKTSQGIDDINPINEKVEPSLSLFDRILNVRDNYKDKERSMAQLAFEVNKPESYKDIRPSRWLKIKTYATGIFWRLFTVNLANRSFNQFLAMIYSGKRISQNNLDAFFHNRPLSSFGEEKLEMFLSHCFRNNDIMWHSKYPFYQERYPEEAFEALKEKMNSVTSESIESVDDWVRLVDWNRQPSMFFKLKTYLKGLFWRFFSKDLSCRSLSQFEAMIYAGKKVTREDLFAFFSTKLKGMEEKGVMDFLVYCFDLDIDWGANKIVFFNELSKNYFQNPGANEPDDVIEPVINYQSDEGEDSKLEAPLTDDSTLKAVKTPSERGV